jgi:hypothetical protein
MRADREDVTASMDSVIVCDIIQKNRLHMSRQSPLIEKRL